MNYTYIVKCADGTFYTGWTNCIEKRLEAREIYKAAHAGGASISGSLYDETAGDEQGGNDKEDDPQKERSVDLGISKWKKR